MASLQLLEGAVGNVVIAPVRDGVELEAVRELHLVLFFEPAALLGTLDGVLALAFLDGIEDALGGREDKWYEFDLFCLVRGTGRGTAGSGLMTVASSSPSSFRVVVGRAGGIVGFRTWGSAVGGGPGNAVSS
jgi:hypothetical protein